MTRRQWQLRIDLGDAADVALNEDVPYVVVYGETFAELRANVAAWLREKQPKKFSTRHWTRGGRQGSTYTFDPHVPDNIRDLFASGDDADARNTELDQNYAERPWHSAPSRSQMGGETFEDLIERVTHDQFEPDKGPDFVDLLMGEDGQPLVHRIKSACKTVFTEQVNDLVRRGWMVLWVIEGEFTLGHPEEGAAPRRYY